MEKDAGKLADLNCQLAEKLALGQAERKAAAALEVGSIALQQNGNKTDFPQE